MALQLSIKKHSVIPGFGITLGFTVFYLSLIVLFPLVVMILKTTSLTGQQILEILGDKRVVHAFELTFGISFLAALINAIFGTIVAWVLVRYEFWGKKIIDGLVDTPFAIPTAVSGIALATLYSQNGWVGSFLAEYDIKIAFNPWGIGLALVFIGFPFVVRTLQPVLEDMNKEVEEAAASLGAKRFQVIYKVILPQLYPALLTGFVMAFARALGEYGSVIFIAGNIPEVSEIVPLIIMIKLEQYDYAGATVVGVGSLAASFVLILILNFLQKWSGANK